MASRLGEPNVDVYQDIHVNYLPLNQAYVILNTTLQNIGVYSVSEDCYKCPYQRLKKYDGFYSEGPTIYRVSTGEQTKWRILKYYSEDYIQDNYKRGLLCEMKPTLEEFGVYRLDVGKCIMETEVPPVNIYLPLLLFCLIMLTAGAAFTLVKLFLRRKHNEARHNDKNLTAKRDNSDIMPSLHFLRGILLILLIFVLTGGGGYPVFNKSYGGLTVANCLLFAYTLTIGLKMPIMFDEESRKKVSKLTALGLIFVRSLTLFIVGVAISVMDIRSRYLATPLWAPLQCIAICYFVVNVCYMTSSSRKDIKPKNPAATAGSLLWCWVIGAVLVIIMIASTYVLYFTECKQYAPFDPRRNSWTANGNNCEEDTKFSEVFNKNLVYVNRDEPFYIDYYYAFTKGLLGIVSTILTALIGLKAGVIYNQHDEHSQRCKLWCFWAAMIGVAGVILAALSGPLNFNLWPISTIFLVSSMTLFVYVFIYRLTEVHQISSSIVKTCGFASVPILTGHLIFSYNFPFYWGMWINNHFIYLWQSTWVVFLWVLVTVCWTKYSDSFDDWF